MRVLIVHYHLKPGGVTTVIRRQLSALASLGVDAAVLSGEAAPGFSGTVSVEPALAYDEPLPGHALAPDEPDPARVAAIVAAVRLEADALGDDTVIHVHNPTIRKNASMLAALAELAAVGLPLVLHVHDLAEDWRPDVYSRQPYPESALWATINTFDAAALRKAGAGTVEFLPDPVPCPVQPETAPRTVGPGLLLCPVRGIRRKNLGEAVLLSLFVRPGSHVGITLPPLNPRELPHYDAWREAAARLSAPVSFGLGLKAGLDELYAESCAVLTTSIKEGFGMSFLEPASRGRATLGRRLQRVVPDFEQAGLAFPALYDSIAVPSGFFDADAFASRITAVVDSAMEAFGEAAECSGTAVVRSIMEASGAGPDYGRLDEMAQAQVLETLANDRLAMAAFISANPFIGHWDQFADGLEPPSHEALGPWSEAAYGVRLARLYQKALEQGGGQGPDKQSLLEQYLRPEAFHGVGI
jgi:glycosyltransferase involved in cell wall biosynthesis